MSFTTFNPSDKLNVTLSGGNLTATGTGTGAVRAADVQFTGKFYFEITVSSATINNNSGCGIGSPESYIAADIINSFGTALILGSGDLWSNGTHISKLSALASGNIIRIAVSLSDKSIWFSINGGNWNGNASYDPATNVGGVDISALCAAGIWPEVTFAANGDAWIANFGGSAFTYSVPSGFTSGWSTSSPTLSLDPAASQTKSATGTSSTTISISTSGPDRIIILAAHNELAAGAKTISSISDTAGLTWSKRKSYADASSDDLEVWWAYAPTQLSGDTITITWSGTFDDATVATTAFFGSNLDTSNPWDANTSLPATSSATSTQGSIGSLSTSAAEAFMLGFLGSGANAGTSAILAGSNYAPVCRLRNGGGSRWSFILMQAARFTSAQSGISQSTATFSSVLWGMIGDAIAANAVPSTAKYRRSLSSLGTRIGSRQRMI